MITGGGSGIGRAACLAFAVQGCSVCVVDISEDGGNDTVQLIKGKQQSVSCLLQHGECVLPDSTGDTLAWRFRHGMRRASFLNVKTTNLKGRLVNACSLGLTSQSAEWSLATLVCVVMCVLAHMHSQHVCTCVYFGGLGDRGLSLTCRPQMQALQGLHCESWLNITLHSARCGARR